MKKIILVVLALCVFSCARGREFVEIETIVSEISLPLNTFYKEMAAENNSRLHQMSDVEREYISFLSHQLELYFMERDWVSCYQKILPSQRKVFAQYWGIMGWISLSQDLKDKFVFFYNSFKEEKLPVEGLKELLFFYVVITYYAENDTNYCSGAGL